VQEEGPGQRAGLRAGDIIRAVDGQVVKDNYDLVSKIASRQPGEGVDLRVFRRPAAGEAGRTLDLHVTLADRPDVASLGGAEPRPEREEPAPEVYESEGLGVTVETLTPRLRERLNLEPEQPGVIITDVAVGSPATSRGLEPDMVITAINDAPIESVADWRRMVGRLDPGASVKLDVIDNQQTTYFFLRVPE
jgi:serine protease Do